MLSVLELTPVTVIKMVVVVTGTGRVTVSPLDASLVSAPNPTTVPSENVSVPDVIWSFRFGRSKSTTLLMV